MQLKFKQFFEDFFSDPVKEEESNVDAEKVVKTANKEVVAPQDVSLPKDTKPENIHEHSDKEARMKHLREVVLENQYKDNEVLNQMFNADKTKILVVVKQSLDLDALRRPLQDPAYDMVERAIPGFNDWEERLRKLCGIKVTPRYVVNVSEVYKDEFGFRRLGKTLSNEVRREYPQDYLDLFDFPTIDDNRAK